MKTTIAIAAAAALVWGVGCQLADPHQSRETPSGSGVGGRGAEAADEDHDGHRHEANRQDRAAAEAARLAAPVKAGADAPDGVERVEAAALLANPDQYRGKQVVVSGTVKGFCHHRRAWFAIDVPEATPPYLRVITAPTFQVPDGVMGAAATTHGTVEVIEVPQARVAHYEEEHRLGSASGEASQTTKRVVLRAAGASFAPAAG